MKVLCINVTDWFSDNVKVDGPKFGKVYEVEDVETNDSEVVYKLEGFNPEHYFSAKCFIHWDESKISADAAEAVAKLSSLEGIYRPL